MMDGMKFMKVEGSEISEILADDNDKTPFDTEDGFNTNASKMAAEGYECYYFGSGDDGAMKIGKMQVEIDGDKYNFNFGKSGSKKGVGKTGVEDKKYYNNGKLMAAGKDEKYQVIMPESATVSGKDTVVGYKKLDDSAKLAETVSKMDGYKVLTDKDEIIALGNLSSLGLTEKKLKDEKYGDLAVFVKVNDDGKVISVGLDAKEFMLVNTSGSVSSSNAKNKDGNNVYYKLSGGKIVSTFSED